MAYQAGYQELEQRDSNDSIVKAGVVSKKSAFSSADNAGIYDVIAENLRVLHEALQSENLTAIAASVTSMYNDMKTNPNFGSISAAASAADALAAKNAAEASETNAKTSETNAKTSETSAEASASGASTSLASIKTMLTQIETYVKMVSDDRAIAQTAASSASTSETNAKASETNAASAASKCQSIVDDSLATLSLAISKVSQIIVDCSDTAEIPVQIADGDTVYPTTICVISASQPPTGTQLWIETEE